MRTHVFASLLLLLLTLIPCSQADENRPALGDEATYSLYSVAKNGQPIESSRMTVVTRIANVLGQNEAYEYEVTFFKGAQLQERNQVFKPAAEVLRSFPSDVGSAEACRRYAPVFSAEIRTRTQDTAVGPLAVCVYEYRAGDSSIEFLKGQVPFGTVLSKTRFSDGTAQITELVSFKKN